MTFHAVYEDNVASLLCPEKYGSLIATLSALEMEADAVYDLSINLFKPPVKQNIVTLDSFTPWL